MATTSSRSKIQTVRLLNLRKLISDIGSATILAGKLGVSAGYVSQVAGRKPTRPISDDFARGVEKKFSLPDGQLDAVSDAGADSVSISCNNQIMLRVVNAFTAAEHNPSFEQMAKVAELVASKPDDPGFLNQLVNLVVLA